MPPRVLVVPLLLAACATAAAADPSPCDDVSYARDFRVRYPAEIDKVFDIERRQQSAWSGRAQAIGERVVAAGAATREVQDADRLALARSGPVAALETQAQRYADEFRLRNDTLIATPTLALLDPLRPNRAWCLLATQALEALNGKVNTEISAWSLLDRALLGAAARRGVQIAPQQ